MTENYIQKELKSNGFWSFISILFLILGMMTFSSCAPKLIPLTSTMVKDLNWTEEDLLQIQYYISKDVVLYADSIGKKIEIDKTGKVVDRHHRKVQEIFLPQHTPGVCLMINSQKNLVISFSANKDFYNENAIQDSTFFVFGAQTARQNRYTLLAEKRHNGYADISFAGKNHRINNEYGDACLLINFEKELKKKKDKITLTGRKVKNKT